jgi:transcriptional regulator GlxA family with amidase domain
METFTSTKPEPVCAPPVVALLSHLIDHAAAHFETDRKAAREYISRAATLLRAERARQGTEPVRQTDDVDHALKGPRRGGLALWQVKRVIAYIDLHLGNPIGAKELTDLTQLSESHFSRSFKISLGLPPFAYIAEKRIERACELMATTDAPLSQIAIECGLCDQSHFCRVFRRKIGNSPNVWRRANTAGPSSFKTESTPLLTIGTLLASPSSQGDRGCAS